MHVTRRVMRAMWPFARAKPTANVAGEETSYAYDDDDLDRDFVIARSVRRYRTPYNPPADIEDIVKSCVEKVCKVQNEDWINTPINDTHTKFMLLDLCASELNLTVPNSYIHEMATISDVMQFYSTPKSNLSKLEEMARAQTKPPNLSIKEQPRVFHPDDKDAEHGGLTLFPGRDMIFNELRDKRIFREFKAKKRWAHYQDKFWDYSVDPPSHAPWTKQQIRILNTPRKSHDK